MSITLPKLLVILGPTASGKSSLAIKLAKQLNGEVISADSRQIYREMDIGTAKEAGGGRLEGGGKIIRGIAHHMIDIVDPGKEFTLAQYKEMAIDIAKSITSRGKLPILAGGTGLYISSVVDNLDIPKAKPDKRLREKIEKDIEKKGLDAAWKKLLELDPEAEGSVDKSNPRRVIRALEVCLATGMPFTTQKTKGKPIFDALLIGIDVPREKLYERINARVDQMLAEGLLDEVKELAEKYSRDLPSMSGIGYRQFRPYLEGRASLEECVELLKRDTRRYAKRQMTWLKRGGRIKWIKTVEEAEKLAQDFLGQN